MGRERRGYNQKGRGWSPELEDGKFVWVAIIIFSGPWLQGQSLQDVTIALMPAMLPREGQTFEDPSVPIFPSLPENEAR
jgi:hypothetical protein